MPQWEYFYFEAGKVFGETKFKDGKVDTRAYIQDLGKGGWELVTVIKRLPDALLMSEEGFVFFFKRLVKEK